MPKQAPIPRRRLSREGLLLIKSFEGFRPRAVARRDGTLTIGYGHTLSAREGIDISEQEAELLLLHDLIPVVDFLNQNVRRNLGQNQFDALVSFVHSIGIERFQRTDILGLIRKGRMQDAAELLAAIPERQQPPIDTPYRRRCAERALFEMDRAEKPSVIRLLLSPISRPGTRLPPPLEAPLGTTGVVRHEGLITTPRWSTPSRKPRENDGDAATIILLAAVGVMLGVAGYMAYQHGANVPVIQTHGLLLGGLLAFLGASILGGAVWIYAISCKPVRKTA
ncbi:lysozyme [Brevundimonas sp. UBA5866]|uniref:lysozyme n=1 Tax=Brevundimonas sp. UBA5866 TaxID=1946132 RepID=UPI0025C1832E|nr:lysozyme [Brevundimonas sp. UBA5866]